MRTYLIGMVLSIIRFFCMLYNKSHILTLLLYFEFLFYIFYKFFMFHPLQCAILLSGSKAGYQTYIKLHWPDLGWLCSFEKLLKYFRGTT